MLDHQLSLHNFRPCLYLYSSSSHPDEDPCDAYEYYSSLPHFTSPDSIPNADNHSRASNTNCPVCSMPIRSRGLGKNRNLLEKVFTHIRFEALDCAMHRAFDRAMSNISNSSCPANGCNYRFISLPRAWTHFITCTDDAHMRCKTEDVYSKVYYKRSYRSGNSVYNSVQKAANFKKAVLSIFPYPFNMLFKTVEMNDVKFVKMLIKEGGEINQRDDYWSTPLMIASKNGYSDIVEVLLNKDADVIDDNYIHEEMHGEHEESERRRCLLNAQNKYGQTALSLAAENNRADIVRKLLSEAGSDGPIDLTLVNNAQMTAAQVARHAGNVDIADMIAEANQERQVRVLLKVLQRVNDKVLDGPFDSSGERLTSLVTATGTPLRVLRAAEKDDDDEEYKLGDDEPNECVICYTEKVDTVLVPCWHARYCELCAKQIANCGVCMSKIERVQRIYLQ